MGSASDWIKKRTIEKVHGALQGFVGQNTSGNCDCKIARINAERTSVTLPDGTIADVSTVGQPGNYATYCAIHNNTGTLVVDESFQPLLDGGGSATFWGIKAATYADAETLTAPATPTNGIADVALYVTTTANLSTVEVYMLDPALLNQITSTIGFSRVNLSVDASINIDYTLIAKLPTAAKCGNHVYLTWGHLTVHGTYDVVTSVTYYWMILKDVTLDKEKGIFTSKTVRTGQFIPSSELTIPSPPRPTWTEEFIYPAFGGGYNLDPIVPSINVTLTFERSTDFPIFLNTDWRKYTVRRKTVLCGTNGRQEPVMDILCTATVEAFTPEIIRVKTELAEGDNGIDCLTAPDFRGGALNFQFHNDLSGEGFTFVSPTFSSTCNFNYGPPWKPEGAKDIILAGDILTDRYGMQIELESDFPLMGATNTWASGDVYYNYDEPIFPLNKDLNSPIAFIITAPFSPGFFSSFCYTNACMQDSSSGLDILREAWFFDMLGGFNVPSRNMNLTASRSVRAYTQTYDYPVAYGIDDGFGNPDPSIEPNTVATSTASWMISSEFAAGYVDTIILGTNPVVSPEIYVYGECQLINASPLPINQLSSALGYPEVKFTKFYNNYVPDGIDLLNPLDVVIKDDTCFPYHYVNFFDYNLDDLSCTGISSTQTDIVQTQTGVLNYELVSGQFGGEIPSVSVLGGLGAPSNHYWQQGQSNRMFTVLAKDLGGDSNIQTYFPARKFMTDWFTNFSFTDGNTSEEGYILNSGFLKDGYRCLIHSHVEHEHGGETVRTIQVDLGEYGSNTFTLDLLELDAYEDANGGGGGTIIGKADPWLGSSSNVVGSSAPVTFERTLTKTDVNLRQFVSDPDLGAPDDASADPDHVYLARVLTYSDGTWGIVQIGRDYTEENPFGEITSMKLLIVELDQEQEGEDQYQVIQTISFNLSQLPDAIFLNGDGDFTFGMETYIGEHIVV